MISCTEFIPLYSEFFTYLDKKGGHDEVMRFWIYLSDTSIGDKTNPNSLASFMEKYGFDGTWKYWEHTLTEEAADCIRIYDPVKKRITTHMRHCPSKGMLLQLKHLTPYYDYCGHCKILYSRVLKNYGIKMYDDHSGIDHAECSGWLCREGDEIEPSDYEVGPGKLVHDMTADDNKYLHRDFHLIGDNALRYCGENYGDNGVVEFMQMFTRDHYGPIIADVKERGMIAIKEKIEKIYDIEEASEVLHTELSDEELVVTVDKSPVIEYMHSLGQKPSKYYIEQTRTLYGTLADECDLGFTLCYYHEDGAAKFRFFKRGF